MLVLDVVEERHAAFSKLNNVVILKIHNTKRFIMFCEYQFYSEQDRQTDSYAEQVMYEFHKWTNSSYRTHLKLNSKLTVSPHHHSVILFENSTSFGLRWWAGHGTVIAIQPDGEQPLQLNCHWLEQHAMMHYSTSNLSSCIPTAHLLQWLLHEQHFIQEQSRIPDCHLQTDLDSQRVAFLIHCCLVVYLLPFMLQGLTDCRVIIIIIHMKIKYYSISCAILVNYTDNGAYVTLESCASFT